MASYVLDTSAILTVLNGEPGRDIVHGILNDARKELMLGKVTIYVPFMALMETEYWTLRRLPPEAVDSMMTLVCDWPVEVVESNPAWRRDAARIKVAGHLSVADAWVAALALSKEALLVHRDPDFDRIQGLQVLRLPS